MKKLLFFLAALFFLSASASAQMKLIKRTTVSASDSYAVYQLYDNTGNNVYTLQPGDTEILYTYNELFQIAKMEYLLEDGEESNYNILYTYNELGQVAMEEEFYGERSNGTTTYTYDAHGNRTSITNSRGGMLIPIQNTYDDDGNLIKVETMHPLMQTVVMTTVDYTYENGLLVSEVRSSQGVVSEKIAYTYNETGQLIQQQNKDAEDAVISTTTFTYADIDVSYIPQSVLVTPNAGNTLTITWQGAATHVFVAGQCYEVSGNSFTTPALQDGTYTVYVANNGNAAIIPEVTVYDTSKVGVSNVHLTGGIYCEWQTYTDYHGEEKTAIGYMFPIAWTLPEGAQPQGYRIYYNSTYYVDVEDGTLRSYTIPAINTTNYVMGQGVVTIPFEIRVIAIYATGQMEPANVISYTLEQTQEIIALSVPMLPSDTKSNSPIEYFDVTGKRLGSNTHGLIIERQAGNVRKYMKK